MKSFICFGLHIVCALILSSVAAGQTSTPSSPTIVVESSLASPESQTTIQQLQKKVISLGCNPNRAPNFGFRKFDSPLSIGDSLGGRVKTIRVVGFTPIAERHTFRQLPEDLRLVWSAKFQSSSCFLAWAEPNLWFVEARLEFEDGTEGLLITDGGSVVIRGHDGTTWYIRLKGIENSTTP